MEGTLTVDCHAVIFFPIIEMVPLVDTITWDGGFPPLGEGARELEKDGGF